MNKKEISEIKKQFTPENCSLTRICGCYVDGEKNKKTELKEAFLSLSEEEMFKYFEIFRKSLSGTIGKNLMNMEFPLEQETEGGTQHFLMKLRESKLTDDALVESFYDKIIENYDYPENYYIILIHGVYDIPGKSSDGAEMFDASDEIYEHIMCCICPVKLSKAGLCYNAETNSIQDRIRDWIVELPDVAFLFPQFNDRFEAIAVRVPTINVTAIDLSVTVKKPVKACEVNLLLQKAAQSAFHGIVDYTELPLVSVDFNHDPHSAIVDGTQTRVSGAHLIKTLVWCDNEWGFANRMLDTTLAMAAQGFR